MDNVIRPCTPADEPSWLWWRALAFLDTQNFRDVVAARSVRPVRTHR